MWMRGWWRTSKYQHPKREICFIVVRPSKLYDGSDCSTKDPLSELVPCHLCRAHATHNCSEKIRAYYTNVDQFIAWTKAATVKNNTRWNKFEDIGMPPRTRSYKMGYMAGSSKLLWWKFGTSLAHRQLIWGKWGSRAESRGCCQWWRSGKIIDCNPERLPKHSEDDQESRIIKVHNAGSVQGHYQGWLQVGQCRHYAIPKKRMEMLMWRPLWKMYQRTST